MTRLGQALLLSALVSWSGEIVIAQSSSVIPDSTLGNESSIVTSQDPNFPIDLITGGATRGANLFHSFTQFNVPEGRGIYFSTSDPATQSILARVTGSSRSSILGTLGVLGAGQPNLFLINPNGILFGANATLDLGGSFVATTANAVKLGETGLFSASEPASSSLLSVNPSAFLVNQIASQSEIINRSTATSSNFALGFPLTPVLSGIEGLQVAEQRSLILLGGGVILEGGKLVAPSGAIEIASFNSSGAIGLRSTAKGLQLSNESFRTLGTIQLLDQGQIGSTNVFGAGTDIRLSGGQVSITGASQVLSGGSFLPSSSGTTDRGRVLIQASQLNVSDKALIGNSGINISPDVVIQADNVNLQNAKVNLPGVFGDAGNITLTVGGAITLDNSALETPSILGGAGGNITITTTNLNLSNRSFIVNGTTIGDANSGAITISATNSIEISKNSFIAADTFSPTGKGGIVSLSARALTIDRGSISSSSFREGQGGDVNIKANQITIRDRGEISARGVSVSASAGNITINTGSLSIADRGKIIASTPSGKGGEINITATDRLVLRRSSGISTEAGTREGSVLIDSIANTDLAFGNAGNITIRTPFIITAPLENSDISSNSFTGRGGQITIDSNSLFWITPLSRADLIRLLGTTEPSQLNASRLLTNSITAVSQQNPELSGNVTLITPDVDPSRGLATLPTNLVDRSNQIAQDCTPRNQRTASSFINTGRGGIPPSPEEALSAVSESADWIISEAKLTQPAERKTPQSITSPTPVIEMQRWVKDQNGDIYFVAHASNVSSTIRSKNCP